MNSKQSRTKQYPRKFDQKRKHGTVPEMSPEARRAVLLAREETKVNNVTPQQKFGKYTNNRTSHAASARLLKENTPTLHNVDMNNNEVNEEISTHKNETCSNKDNTQVINNHKSSSSSNGNNSTRNTRVSVSSSRPPRVPKTARSRSTISQNEPPFSMSDNNEIISHFGTNTNTTTSNASVYTSNLSSKNYNHNNTNASTHGTGTNNHNDTNHISGNTNINKRRNSRRQNLDNADANLFDDDDNDSALPNDDSFDDVEDDRDNEENAEENEEDSELHKDSFVIALDKALESNYVNRLKGDITDTSRVSKPGTVRALNGGRLTNAQEVVVNVCHNDDKELVFHDDDDESVDTAKAISEIRVNIWMEYNSRFPPDHNDLNEFDQDTHFNDISQSGANLNNNVRSNNNNNRNGVNGTSSNYGSSNNNKNITQKINHNSSKQLKPLSQYENLKNSQSQTQSRSQSQTQRRGSLPGVSGGKQSTEKQPPVTDRIRERISSRGVVGVSTGANKNNDLRRVSSKENLVRRESTALTNQTTAKRKDGFSSTVTSSNAARTSNPSTVSPTSTNQKLRNIPRSPSSSRQSSDGGSNTSRAVNSNNITNNINSISKKPTTPNRTIRR